MVALPLVKWIRFSRQLAKLLLKIQNSFLWCAGVGQIDKNNNRRGATSMWLLKITSLWQNQNKHRCHTRRILLSRGAWWNFKWGFRHVSPGIVIASRGAARVVICYRFFIVFWSISVWKFSKTTRNWQKYSRPSKKRTYDIILSQKRVFYNKSDSCLTVVTNVKHCKISVVGLLTKQCILAKSNLFWGWLFFVTLQCVKPMSSCVEIFAASKFDLKCSFKYSRMSSISAFVYSVVSVIFYLFMSLADLIVYKRRTRSRRFIH